MHTQPLTAATVGVLLGLAMALATAAALVTYQAGHPPVNPAGKPAPFGTAPQGNTLPLHELAVDTERRRP